MRDMTKIKNQLMIQSIKRWHLVPLVENQTVADHTCGVVLIARWIWTLVFAEMKHVSFTGDKRFMDPGFIIIEALDHDMDEVGRGDKPTRTGTLEKAWEKFAGLETHEKIVKLADVTEAYLTLDRLGVTAHGKYIKSKIEEFILLASTALIDRHKIKTDWTEDTLAKTNHRISTEIFLGLTKSWDYSVED